MRLAVHPIPSLSRPGGQQQSIDFRAIPFPVLLPSMPNTLKVVTRTYAGRANSATHVEVLMADMGSGRFRMMSFDGTDAGRRMGWVRYNLSVELCGAELARDWITTNKWLRQGCGEVPHRYLATQLSD